jgi:arginyl-tRNA synthetase
MNIFNKLREDIINAGQHICDDHELLQQATVEIPKDTLNGDLSTNIDYCFENG